MSTVQSFGKKIHVVNVISNIRVYWKSVSNVGDVGGRKKELIELGTKPTAQQEINISFRHSTHIFESIEELEIDEFQSSQMNWLKPKYKRPFINKIRVSRLVV